MVAKVNTYFVALMFGLGMCIGYYLMPFFVEPREDEKSFEKGMLYGIMLYKDDIHRMGTYSVVNDSVILVIVSNDSLVIYK